MFKKTIFFTFIAIGLIVVSITLAQENPDAKPATISGTVDEEKIKALKEKLATKVAELTENQTRGFTGEIAALTKTNFTLATLNNSEVKVRFNEDISIFKMLPKKSAAAVKDLKNTLMVSVLGIYDQEANQLSSQVMFIESQPKFYAGEITQIDKANNLIIIRSATDKQMSIDYESTTQTTEYQKTGDKIIKSGLSKLEAGDRVEIWGNPSENDNEKVAALKILKLPKSLFKPAETNTASPSATLTASPSASLKASPKATPKPTPKASA